MKKALLPLLAGLLLAAPAALGQTDHRMRGGAQENRTRMAETATDRQNERRAERNERQTERNTNRTGTMSHATGTQTRTHTGTSTGTTTMMRGNGAPANTGRARADVTRFRGTATSSHRYRMRTAYHPPRNYHYRRWSPGQRLPSYYFVRDYWILDFGDFGLFAPPPGYVWVRFGPDAILIDEYTGEVVRVVYNVFW